MKFSDQQDDVLNLGFDNILVSAAAGSGKTTVLVERIIRKLIDGSLTLDRLAVMTFTVAAADNMVAKINKQLKKRITEEKDAEIVSRLKEQLNYLPSAYIQTTNSFCVRVINEKGSELEDLEYESGLSLLGDSEKDIILKRAAEKVLSDRYLSFENEEELLNSPFMNLTRSFGDGRNDAYLVDNMVEVYSKLRSLPNYLDLIEEAVANREDMDDKGVILFLSALNEKMINSFESAFESAENTLDKLDFFGLKSDKYSIAENLLKYAIEQIRPVCAFNGSEEERFDLIREALINLGNIGHPNVSNYGNEFKESYAPCCALYFLAQRGIKSCKTMCGSYLIPDEYLDRFLSGKEVLLKEQKQRTVRIREFKYLLVKMDEEYALAKKKLRVMDYPDQEHIALKVLSDPEINKHYKDKFCEIYVDEYQDNSSLQDRIVQCISDKNLFLVGDVKQSIYKFRYADPGNFISRSIRYKDKESHEGQVRELNTNFRSTPQILNFVNKIFEQLMSSEATEIEYDKTQMLNPSDEMKDTINDLPKIVCVSKSQEEDEYLKSELFEKSTGTSARQLKAIISEVKTYLLRPDSEPKDICILTRSNARSREISNVLNKLGIPAVCNEVRNIYSDSDIATICALITVLGNAHRDECLIGVLLAGYRFSNFTLDEIAKITLLSSDKDLIKINLIEKIRLYADQEHPHDLALFSKVKNFLEVFDDLRSETMMLNIGELIEKIYAYTGILATVKHEGDGDVKKFRSFKRWMCERFGDMGSDICAISNELEELKIEMEEGATFDFESNEQNAISVMTEHKSKGLEYPFVIVAQLKSQKKPEKPKQIIFDDKVGFVSYDFDDGEVLKSLPSMENKAYDSLVHLSELSEELRLLYVALTRAMKNLTVVLDLDISDTRSKFYKKVWTEKKAKFSKKAHEGAADLYEEFLMAVGRFKNADDIRNAAKAIDMPFISGISDFDEVIIDSCQTDEIEIPECDRTFETKTVMAPSLSIIDYDIYGKPIFEEYEFEKSVNAPSKTSVSQMKKEEMKLSFTNEEDITKTAINLVVPKLEYFEAKGTYNSASAKGTLIHNLLHFMDFPSILNDMESGKTASEALDHEIDYLCERGIVKPDMVPVLDEFRNELMDLVSSDLFRRIATAENNGNADFERPILFSTKVDDTDDDTLVQGVLDVIFFEGDEAVIVDYKTDKISSDDDTEIRRALEERHKLQLDLYAASVEASGIKVKEKIIWLVRKGRAYVL